MIKLIHRLKIGKFEWSLYGRPRKKPLYAEQAVALENFKKAVLDELEPLFMPIVKWLDRIIGYAFRPDCDDGEKDNID